MYQAREVSGYTRVGKKNVTNSDCTLLLLSVNTFKQKFQTYDTEAYNFCLILIIAYFVTISEHSSIINDVDCHWTSTLVLKK